MASLERGSIESQAGSRQPPGRNSWSSTSSSARSASATSSISSGPTIPGAQVMRTSNGLPEPRNLARDSSALSPASGKAGATLA